MGNDAEMGSIGSRLAILMLTVVAAGCASGGGHTASGGGAQIAGATCSAASPGSSVTRPCVFMLADGRRFRCPVAIARSMLTAETLEHAKGCVPMRSLVIPPKVRAVVATISRARACLDREAVPVTGGPLLPANPPSSTSADGELVAGGAFIGFYVSAARAQRLESVVARNASRFGGEVQRRGSVTVVWVHAPSSAQRATIDACAVA